MSYKGKDFSFVKRFTSQFCVQHGSLKEKSFRALGLISHTNLVFNRMVAYYYWHYQSTM